MTEAELIEQINKKRNELEEKRAEKASIVLLKSLEDEIRDLESSLAGNELKSVDTQAFTDECAG